MEYLDVYTLEGLPTGRTIDRASAFSCLNPSLDRLLLVHVCVFNSNGKMLLQRRVLSKDRYPGMWDVSAGGFVHAGESSADAVKRELLEEIGLDASKSGIDFVLREPFGLVFDDFYAVYADPILSELKLQSSEVMDVGWFDRDSVMEMLNDGILVDYPKSLISMMFDTFSTCSK